MLEWLLSAVVLSLPVGIYAGNHLFENRQHLRGWEKAMALCRVKNVESTGFWAWWAQLKARTESIEVRITRAGGSSKRAAVLIEGPESFSILKLSRQLLKLWKREIEIGDKDFDDAFLVEGPVQPVSALLDAALRSQLVRAHADCNPLEIGDNQLRVEVSEERLPFVLPLLLEIGRQLAEPLDVKSRIAHNARHDPEPGVRLFNLLLLMREHPGDPETVKTLRAACTDNNPKVRVRAAIELDREKILLKLAERMSDDASSALAVSHLGGKLPFERVRDILSRSLRKDFHQTARACLETLGQRRAEAVDVLAGALEEEGEIAVAAAHALGATGAAQAEPPLLQALGSEDSDIREAAAASLGRVGTAEAVQPLKDAAERFWLDLGLRRATRQAIAEIQSRLEGASPGQLSLAQAEAGQLSLAVDSAGQLSHTHAQIPLLPHAADEPEQPSRNAGETPGVRQG